MEAQVVLLAFFLCLLALEDGQCKTHKTMEKTEYDAPVSECIDIVCKSRILTGSDNVIDNPGIGGPGPIPIE